MSDDIDWDAAEAKAQERLDFIRAQGPGTPVELDWDTPEGFAFAVTMIREEVIGTRIAQNAFEPGSMDWHQLQLHMMETLRGVPDSALKCVIDGMAAIIVAHMDEEGRDV